jgi:hypothetical protein
MVFLVEKDVRVERRRTRERRTAGPYILVMSVARRTTATPRRPIGAGVGEDANPGLGADQSVGLH